MDFGTIKDSVMLFLMFVVFGVPALAIAARIGSRPVVEAIVRARESLARTNAPEPDPRVDALEQEVSRLSDEVRRLRESDAFVRELLKSTSPEALPKPGETRS